MTNDEERPPSNLSVETVANKVERIVDKHEGELTGYEKTWIRNAVEYVRYLNTTSGNE